MDAFYDLATMGDVMYEVFRIFQSLLLLRGLRKKSTCVLGGLMASHCERYDAFPGVPAMIGDDEVCCMSRDPCDDRG